METQLHSLCDRLKSFYNKIYKSQQSQLHGTSPEYTESPSAPSDNINIHHHHHNHNSSLLDIMWFNSLFQHKQSVVVNNYNGASFRDSHSNSDMDEKEKKNKEPNKLMIVLLTTGLSFIGTYVLSTDDYIMFTLSKINNKFRDFKKLQHKENNEFTPHSEVVVKSYESWEKSFNKRVVTKFYGKISLLTSLLFAVGGYYYNETLFNVTIASSIGSGCYLFFRWLTEDTLTEHAKSQNVLASMEMLKIACYNSKIKQHENQTQQNSNYPGIYSDS